VKLNEENPLLTSQDQYSAVQQTQPAITQPAITQQQYIGIPGQPQQLQPQQQQPLQYFIPNQGLQTSLQNLTPQQQQQLLLQQQQQQQQQLLLQQQQQQQLLLQQQQQSLQLPQNTNLIQPQIDLLASIPSSGNTITQTGSNEAVVPTSTGFDTPGPSSLHQPNTTLLQFPQNQ
jgi:hypothetical protein